MLEHLKNNKGVAIDLIRIAVGGILFIRGVLFIVDSAPLLSWIQQLSLSWMRPATLVYYITLTHLVGGLLLVAGLFTRWVALAQLPILAGALFYVPLGEDLFARSQSLELSVLMLLLLLLVLLFGAGKPSLDAYYFGTTFKADPVEPASDPPEAPVLPSETGSATRTLTERGREKIS